MGKKINKQNGGLTSNVDFNKAFQYFINNSYFRFLTHGANGVVIIANLKNNIVSTPYYSLRSKNYGEPVTQLIIKLVLVHESIDYHYNFISTDSNDWRFLNETINYSNPMRFAEEVISQNDIAINTMTYLEPSCPVVVYSNIYENNESINIINLMKNNAVNYSQAIFLNQILNALNKKFQKNITQNGNTISVPDNNKVKLGIVAMEMISNNFITLSYYYNTKISNITEKYTDLFEQNEKDAIEKMNDEPEIIKFDFFKNMARLTILSIAVNSGYTQGDYHFGNILIDTNYEGFYLKSKSFSFPDIEIADAKDNNIDNDNINLLKNEFEQINNISSNSTNVESTPLTNIPKNTKFSFYTPETPVKPWYLNRGGGDNNLDKGKALIIDYGYSNSIPIPELDTLRENIGYILSNIKTINIQEFTERINTCLQIIYMTPRNDDTTMDDYEERYYGWFMGKYFCSMCDNNPLLIRNGLTKRDYEQMFSLIKMRNNAIEYLTNRPSTKSLPFNFPLNEETIVKLSFNALNNFDFLKNINNNNENNTTDNSMVGGNKNLDILIQKCFLTIGYGLISIKSLQNKINKVKNSMKNIETPYKLIDTTQSFKPISVGVGGKKKKTGKKCKTKKSLKNKKNKTRKTYKK